MKTDDKVRAGVQQEVQAILGEYGNVKPTVLLKRATPKESPAHDGFTWDNKKAAHEYRLYEARHWLRVIVVKTDAPEPERLVHVPVIKDAEDIGSREGEYKPISVVADNPDEYVRARDAVIAQGKALAKALQELDMIAAKRGKSDITAIIAQISRGLDLFEQAIETMH